MRRLITYSLLSVLALPVYAALGPEWVQLNRDTYKGIDTQRKQGSKFEVQVHEGKPYFKKVCDAKTSKDQCRTYQGKHLIEHRQGKPGEVPKGMKRLSQDDRVRIAQDRQQGSTYRFLPGPDGIYYEKTCDAKTHPTQCKGQQGGSNAANP